MEIQTTVMEKIYLEKPPKQIVNSTQFHNSPQQSFDQLNQKITFAKRNS